MSTNNPFFKGAVNNIFSNSSSTIQQPVNINAGTNIFNKSVALGTMMTTNLNSNLQPIGSYRAPGYISDKAPIGGIKTNWTSLIYPITILRERQIEELSALELRLQDYYSIRTGNIQTKNRNQIQMNIRKATFKRSIFQTRPTHQPITINGILPNSSLQTTSTNIFSNNSNNSNIFSNNTNTVVTNPQNIFNNLNNSGIFNKPNTSQPTLVLNNNTGNIFKPTTNSSNIFTSQNNMNTSTTNIFNKPNTTGNIFANNQTVASTNPSTSVNIFANNNNNNNTSQGTNIFNTNNTQSNNIFNNMRTSTTGNNIFNNNNNNNNTGSINLFNNTSNNQGINLFNTNNNNNNSNNNGSIFNNTNSANLFTTTGASLQQVVLPVPESLYQSLIQEAYGSKNSYSTSYESNNSSLSNPYSSNRNIDDYSYKHKSNGLSSYSTNDDIDFEPKFRYSDFDKKYDQEPTIKIIIQRSSKNQQHTKRKTSEEQKFYDIHQTRKISNLKEQQRKTRSKIEMKDQSYIPDQAVFEERQIKVYETIFLDDKIQKAREIVFRLNEKDRNNSNQILKDRIAQEAIDAGEIKPDSKIILTDIRFEDGQFIAVCLLKSRTINLPQGYWFKPQKITDFKSTRLTVGNKYGQVSWLQPLDVTNIDFFQTLQITKNSVQLYQNTQNPPPVGTKLNRQCNVTLYKCQPLQSMRKKGKNPSNGQIIQLLKTVCKRNNLQFVSFNAQNEHWTIKITPRD